MYQKQLELLASFAGRLGEYLVHCSLSVIKCRGVRKMLTHRQNHPVLVWTARQQRLTVHRYKYLYSIYPFWGACIFPSIFSGFLISHSSIVKFDSPWHNVLRWDGQRMLCAPPEKDACALHAPTDASCTCIVIPILMITNEYKWLYYLLLVIKDPPVT